MLIKHGLLTLLRAEAKYGYQLRGEFEAATGATRPRDELAIKLALALAVPGVKVATVVQRQRASTTQSMRELTRLKRGSRDADISWLLVLESMMFAAEAESRWLDQCEAIISRYRKTAGADQSTGTTNSDQPAAASEAAGHDRTQEAGARR